MLFFVKGIGNRGKPWQARISSDSLFFVYKESVREIYFKILLARIGITVIFFNQYELALGRICP